MKTHRWLRTAVLCSLAVTLHLSAAHAEETAGTAAAPSDRLAPAVVLAASQAAAAPKESKVQSLVVYIGTYTQRGSRGIYIYRLDLASGALAPLGVASGVTNPSFLALHPGRRFLYAVSEVADSGGKRTGAVTAFAIDPQTGQLTQLNHQSSEGAGPCHVVVDHAGKNVLVANYGGGSVAALPIRDDGRLAKATASVQHTGSSVNPGRQDAPHAHSINVDPANRFAFAADLGLDKILVYRLDAQKGTLAPNNPPAASVAPGAGPRHFAFHPTGRFAYVINEIACTVTAFAYDAPRGLLTEIQTISTLPRPVQQGDSTAEVQVHPTGRFLYGSNRGHNSIAIFSIDPATGRLTSVGHEPTRGKTPRNFGLDPTGAYLLAANQDSDSAVVFRIDPHTGRLTATGHTADVPMPVCVKFLQPSDN